MTFLPGRMSRAAPKHWAPCSLHCGIPAKDIQLLMYFPGVTMLGYLTPLLVAGSFTLSSLGLLMRKEHHSNPPCKAGWAGGWKEGRKEHLRIDYSLLERIFLALRGPPLGSDGKVPTRGTPQPHPHSDTIQSACQHLIN